MSIQITVITSIPDSPFYGISLHHILSLIKQQDNQRWSILNFDQTWVVAERWQNPDVTFSQIIDDAVSIPGGYAVTWEQLTQIASAIFQTICCMIVAVNVKGHCVKGNAANARGICLDYPPNNEV